MAQLAAGADRESVGQLRPIPAEPAARLCAYYFSLRVNASRCSASTVKDLGNFVKVRINLVGHIVKLAPGLAKVGRLVSLLQELTILPLDIVDNAPAIEAAMQAD
jgi:hypothetical protein